MTSVVVLPHAVTLLMMTVAEVGALMVPDTMTTATRLVMMIGVIPTDVITIVGTVMTMVLVAAIAMTTGIGAMTVEVVDITTAILALTAKEDILAAMTVALSLLAALVLPRNLLVATIAMKPTGRLIGDR